MYFGMKAHIGADDESGLMHTVVSTAANVSDISQTAELLHDEESRVGADTGYVGVTKREEMQKKLQAMPHEVRWHIAKRGKPIREMAECWQKYWRWPLRNARRASGPESSIRSIS
jgi:transposase, IS5 family